MDGVFTFIDFKIIEKPSFFDFLKSGWRINLMTAVDFTMSNGDVADPSSLHYLDPLGSPNNYQKAIS